MQIHSETRTWHDKNIQSYGDKVYTNFCGFNVPKDGVECEHNLISSIDFLLVYENIYYIEVYLGSSAYKIINTQMIYYLDHNLFESDENRFFDEGVLSMRYHDRIG